MSNSVSHNVLNQALLQTKIPATTLLPRTSVNQVSTRSLNKLYGSNLVVQKPNFAMKSHHRSKAVTTRATLATESTETFKLDGSIELQVVVCEQMPESPTQVEIKVTSSSDSLFLHWGCIQDRRDNWVLPSCRPHGTKVFNNQALRTLFPQSGSNSSLKIEIEDPTIQAIEFLILDERQNRWFKNNGSNFHVKLPAKKNSNPNVTVPEDLVQVQAYMRWERKGKQNYSREQEKVEYEAARAELVELVSRGTSIQELREKLNKKEDVSDRNQHSGPSESYTEGTSQPSDSDSKKIPEDLVQVQAYLRWEKAGKPNYSKDQQLKEFEEARKDLQREVEKGASVQDIRKKISKGEIKAKVAKPTQTKQNFRAGRIQRKNRDLMQILNKNLAKPVDEQALLKPKTLTAVELYTKKMEEKDGNPVLNRCIFKIGDRVLMALVSKPAGKTKVLLATDFKEPITLHWALSKSNAGEWLEPPPQVQPRGSVVVPGAAETPFLLSSTDEVKYLEIEINDDDFKGMPFVILSAGNWIKNNGSDFYVNFVVPSRQSSKAQKDAGDGKGTAKNLLETIAEMESEAQKSFMHRFNIAADLAEQAKDAGERGLAAILVWMRYMATRQLIWNKNYNVKPREISKAQDRLTDNLQNIYTNHPEHRELLRMIMSTVGRGGEGDVGQRIRDEILVIQRNNDCKGGMMEEWHQKLHNNTSPDDVIICQALLDYIKNDFDMNVYWKTLIDNGITKERLLSYDRAIHSEPNFRRDQKDSLLRDLGNYMRTLKAVHSGADLESAISNCMGYRTEGQGFMVGVQVNAIPGLPSEFPDLLGFVLDHIEDNNVEALLEGLLEARQELRPLLSKPDHRLKDLLFLDIALDSAVRTAVERGYEQLNSAGPEKLMYFISMVLENLALSSDDNEDLIYCSKGWNQAMSMLKSNSNSWALYAKSILDRSRLALAHKAESYQRILQPSADYLGSLLGVDEWAVSIFTEEIIRAGSAASLSSLLNRLDPVLRKTANLGSWQVISPVEVVGYVVAIDELLSVQNKVYERPTILVAKSVKGEEEIPDGTVAVLTPDMPDVLSHVSVRARNGKVCFATCFDPNILSDLQAKNGKLLRLVPTSSDVTYSEVKEDELAGTSSSNGSDGAPSNLTLVKKEFRGRYAISSDEFTNDMVGAKSRNISYIKGKLPSWIGIPTSVALPFGVFEKVLSDDSNKGVATKLEMLKKKLKEENFDSLKEIRETVLDLAAPPALVEELKTKMKSSDMPWPGDDGEHRWNQAWTAIKKVWASKWNERAYFSTRKIKVDHDYLCMAVLVQEIINADYAFVIHTTNPSSGDESEIYAEVVKGLGETLVGAYPGRALSFICKKDKLDSPELLGYPSKPIGLFIKRSIIFRSDSNGEDLEGYAGAGLYDSVPMDEEEQVVLDYSSDPLVADGKFRKSMMESIARAGNAIEELYGTPQDIEGVIRGGKLYVVQTRPQM